MKRVVLFGLVFALCIPTVPGQVHVQSGNLWDTYLGKNSEHLLMLFKDGELVVITENEETRVSLPWDYVFKTRKPGDLILVIHNHLRLGRFSGADKKLFRLLKNSGFTGRFLCRLGSGHIIEMEED